MLFEKETTNESILISSLSSTLSSSSSSSTIEDIEDIIYINDDIKTINKKTYLIYEEDIEMQNEINDLNNHTLKKSNFWLSAKQIVSYSLNNNNPNKCFFWDYLDILFKDTKDTFDDIKKVIYSSNEFCIEFDNSTISKYIVDNIKINKFKPSGYLFNSNDYNKWEFKIVVITNKNIYAANRYIIENTIGFY